ncbi:MAG TPA: hypothetical protein VIS72_09780 [Anaerolineales bacterium]
MSEHKKKPSRWYYVLALSIPIIACVGTAFLAYSNVPELPGALEEFGVQDLTQVVVPGSADVSFPKKGAYAVYYEYRSVIDGVGYVREEYPPIMRCELRSKATGKAVKLEPTNVKGNVYVTHNPNRAGVMYKEISIDQPGIYTFSCQYTDSRTIPKSVMAVGPNIVWGFFNIAIKPIAAFFAGGLVFFIGLGISILMIVFVAFKRHQSTSNLTGQA